MQITAVITSSDQQKAQRAANLFLTWHRQASYAAELEDQPSGVRPARIDQLLTAPEETLRRRFAAAEWAIMIATTKLSGGGLKLRIDGAPEAGVRAFARWFEAKAPRTLSGEANIITRVWTASKPVLAMMHAIRGRFHHTPTLGDLCFHSDWVAPALEAEPVLAEWLNAVPELEYRAADRVEFRVPNLKSGELGQSK
jgi:hypothetical protein